jgi:hypothetical protein
MIDQHDLSRIMVRNGLSGRAERVIQYFIKGSGDVTVKYDSLKGGTVTKTITLQ